MELIHRTAVIDEGVSLASDVRVGPYAVISGPVRFGRGRFVSSHAVIMGPVIIGVRNKNGSGAVIGGYPQDLSFNPDVDSTVEIGDDNVIREHCTIHRGTIARRGLQRKVCDLGSEGLRFEPSRIGRR
jgi:UDP-N-acetylglucosamine acyltransferase